MFDSFLSFYRIPRTLDTMIILFFLILVIFKSFAPFSSSNHPIEIFLTRVINFAILDFLSTTASFYSISHRQFWNLHLREHPRANITDQSHSVSKLLDPRSLVVFPSIDLRSRIDNSRTVYPFRLRPSPFHDRIESLEGPSISATIDPSRSRYSSRTVYTAFL